MQPVIENNPLARDLDAVLERTEPLWHELRGERILITGATGFFGCWLLESFAWANRRLELKAQAVAMSRSPQTLEQKAPHLASNAAISQHACDVRSDKFPDGAFSHMIHAATEASAALNRQSPQLMFDTIVTGTRRALDFAASNSVKKFLFVSSGAVYGTQPPEFSQLSESYGGGPDPLDSANAYAEGKRAAEMKCALAATSSPNLEVKIARCFAFVGPYMQLDAHFAMGNFISDYLNDRPIRILGDGSAVRSYLYASDLVVWLWTILFNGKPTRAYNVGSEDAVSIGALAREVPRALSRRADIITADVTVAPRVTATLTTTATACAAHRYVPCTARSWQELGLRAEVALPDAIRRTHDWFANHGRAQQVVSKETQLARGNHA